MGALATRAVRVFGFDRHIDARQMSGKRATIGAALVRARAFVATAFFLSSPGLAPGNRLLDILERQKQLFGIKLLRTPAKLRTLQLAQEMPQAINLRQRPGRARRSRHHVPHAPPRPAHAALRYRWEAEVRSHSCTVLNQIRAAIVVRLILQSD